MRRKVGYEGRGPSGHIVTPGGIVMDSESVPIFFGHDFTKVIGRAGDLKRAHRTLTMDFQLDNQYRFNINLRYWLATLSLKDMEAEPLKEGRSKLRIHRAVIRSIGLFPIAMPKELGK